MSLIETLYEVPDVMHIAKLTVLIVKIDIRTCAIIQPLLLISEIGLLKLI